MTDQLAFSATWEIVRAGRSFEVHEMIGGQAGKTVIHDIPDRATAEAVVEARRASFEAAIETQLNRLREGK